MSEPSAPIVVTALFGPGDDRWIQEMRRANYPPERNRVPAHLTLFHQLPPSAESELSRRIARHAAAPPPRARILGAMDLGAGTALRVESEELEDIRMDLAEGLHGLLSVQDRAPWRPHITVQNKVEPKEARALQQRLRAILEPRPLHIRGLAAWRYLGGPWEKLRDWPFRG
ncbi:MAG TPA: 2'-5' RNA ligase family protein [Allosphingosinicella sp.]|jgi:hypothetical protein